jgi:hypothetical protein
MTLLAVFLRGASVAVAGRYLAHGEDGLGSHQIEGAGATAATARLRPGFALVRLDASQAQRGMAFRNTTLSTKIIGIWTFLQLPRPYGVESGN